MTLVLEQALNGLQFGVMLFLLAAGLTLIFGIMGLVNLAHGSFYMVGAYAAAWIGDHTHSFVLAILAGIAAAGVVGVVCEITLLKRLYARDHLDQVLATFGLILFFNEAAAMIFGRQPLLAQIPGVVGCCDARAGTALPGVSAGADRLRDRGCGRDYWLINCTRLGMLVRAGATHRDMVRALGVRIGLLYTAVFGLGAALAGLAGAMTGPLLSVEVGMGDRILIITFVVIVIGGIGSIRGAFFGAILVGMVDTLARAFLPALLQLVTTPLNADVIGAGLSSMAVFLLMAVVLLICPRGLFPANG